MSAHASLPFEIARREQVLARDRRPASLLGVDGRTCGRSDGSPSPDAARTSSAGYRAPSAVSSGAGLRLQQPACRRRSTRPWSRGSCPSHPGDLLAVAAVRFDRVVRRHRLDLRNSRWLSIFSEPHEAVPVQIHLRQRDVAIGEIRADEAVLLVVGHQTPDSSSAPAGRSIDRRRLRCARSARMPVPLMSAGWLNFTRNFESTPLGCSMKNVAFPAFARLALVVDEDHRRVRSAAT